MKRKVPITLAGLPRSYAALVGLHPPRPIHSREDYLRTVALIDVMAGHDLHADQADYLDVLALMVERYEADRLKARLRGVGPTDVVRHLVEENALTVSDLGRIVGSQPLASLILAGKRAISRDVAMRLARHFHVSPALFLASLDAQRKIA